MAYRQRKEHRSTRRQTRVVRGPNAERRAEDAERERRKAERARKRSERAHRRKVLAAHEPSVVERLAALTDPDGPQAKNLALWKEREAERISMLDYLQRTYPCRS